jgi:hypothetical protein
MKFVISNASHSNNFPKNAKPIPNDPDGEREVDVNSLEDLRAIENQCGTLIISFWNDNTGYDGHIEIYDSYRE